MIEKVYAFFDPKRAMWLEILRWFVIIVGALLAVGTVILAVAVFIDLVGSPFYGFFESLLTFIMVLIGGAVVTALHLFFGMISLNLLYNVQQIRYNTQMMRENTEKEEDK